MTRGAILEIGSNLVRGISPSLSTQVVLPILPEFDYRRTLGDVAQATREVLSRLSRTNEKPREVTCFLSAPFYVSRTRVIRKKAAAPFLFSPQLVKDLATETPLDLPPGKLLENRIYDIKLNGYRVLAPEGQWAHEVELSNYLSYATVQVARFCLEAITAFPAPVKFRSGALALVQALNRAEPNSTNYLALEFGGELAEVSLVWQSAMHGSASSLLGENWLLRELAKKMGSTLLEAQTLLRARASGLVEPRTEQKLERILTELKSIWLPEFFRALRLISPRYFLVPKIFILGDAGAAAVIKQWVDKNFCATILKYVSRY